MVQGSAVLLKQISNKLWNSTIKIPELKAALPIVESIYDEAKVTELLTNMFEEHKGRILVITGAGNSVMCMYVSS